MSRVLLAIGVFLLALAALIALGTATFTWSPALIPGGLAFCFGSLLLDRVRPL